MKIKSILFGLLTTIALTSCSGNASHEHTFSEEWSYNASCHWKDATCEHTDLSKDRGEHIDLDGDGKCDICQYVIPVDQFSFVFNSDYCSLNNNDYYSKNTEVSLILSINDEHKDYYVVPNDISVLIGKSIGVNGVDYTYSVDKETNKATLSLKVTNSVVVTALYKDSENIYRVGPNQFAHAKDFSNFDFVQASYVESTITPYLSRMNEIVMDLSPTINYQYGSMAITGGSDHIYYEMFYYEHCGDYLNKYAYDINNLSWVQTREDDINYFIYPNSISNRVLYRLDLITYDLIKDCYDEESKSYKFKLNNELTIYDVTMSFDQNKIVAAKYRSVQSNTIETKETYLSYEEYTPELPK